MIQERQLSKREPIPEILDLNENPFAPEGPQQTQQNNTAAAEYTSDAFAAPGTMDSSHACSASCQLTAPQSSFYHAPALSLLAKHSDSSPQAITVRRDKPA